MKLEWGKHGCSCEVVNADGNRYYEGEHDGPHTAESPWGTYSVEPYSTRYRATFTCACCRDTSTIVRDETWVGSYRAALEHFGDMFKRRMMP